jgi:hypothetical protein
MTLAKNLSPVSLTTGEQFIFPRCRQKKTKRPKIYCCCQRHREKLFTGVNDTADKFFGGVSDTGD